MLASIMTTKRMLAKRMRERPTPAEHAAWQLLRGKGCFGLRFRRQVVIGPFIVDFYCPRLRIAIEIDGDVHDVRDTEVRDADRDALIAAQHVTVLRVRNADVSQQALEDLLRPHLPPRSDAGHAAQEPEAQPITPLPVNGEGTGEGRRAMREGHRATGKR